MWTVEHVERCLGAEILREFSADIVTPTEELTDNVILPGMFRRSAATSGIASCICRLPPNSPGSKARPPRPNTEAKHLRSSLAPILKTLLDECTVTSPPDRLCLRGRPSYSGGSRKLKSYNNNGHLRV